MINNFLIIFYFVCSFLLLKNSLGILRKYLADVPNNRSSHNLIKPKGGGIIFVLNSILGFIYTFNYSFLINIPLAIIGLIDDKYNLPRKIRFLSQLLTVFFILIINSNLEIFFFINQSFLFLLFLLIGVSIINFSNFMDGIDGIVAGCFFVIFAISTILINQSYVFITLSILAFLFLNWYPSKVFMGDIGSTFLGASYFTILCQANSISDFMGLLFMSFPLMGDAFICVVKRYMSGRKVFLPHRDHLYQRLCDNGLSQSLVASIYISATLLIALGYVFGGIFYSLFFILISIYIGFILEKKLAIKF